jgi:hypothetical protein
MKNHGLLIATLAGTLCTTNVLAGTWIVGQNGKSDFDTIQGAIEAANEGDEVLVMTGHYDEQINFLGKAITVVSESGPENTTIDGNGEGSVVSFTSSESADSTLQGFTITGGTGTWIPNVDGDQDIAGGGILVMNSSATIINCVIKGNELYTEPDHAYNNATGAGAYVENGTLVLDNCSIKENTATGTHAQSTYTYAFILGAGVGSLNSTLTIGECEVVNNTGSTTATNPSWIHTGIYGVGISVRGGNASIENCNVASNSGSIRSLGSTGSNSFMFGLGIATMHEANTVITNTTVQNNTGSIENTQTYYDRAVWAFGAGVSGGINGWPAMEGDASIEVIDSIISGNTVEFSTPYSGQKSAGAGIGSFSGWDSNGPSHNITISTTRTQIFDNSFAEVTTEETCPDDVNSDGAVNTFDLLSIIDSWGNCP